MKKYWERFGWFWGESGPFWVNIGTPKLHKIRYRIIRVLHILCIFYRIERL